MCFLMMNNFININIISISHVYVYFGCSRLVRAGSIIKTVISFHVLYFPFGCHRPPDCHWLSIPSNFDLRPIRSELVKGSSCFFTPACNLHVVVCDYTSVWITNQYISLLKIAIHTYMYINIKSDVTRDGFLYICLLRFSSKYASSIRSTITRI